MTTGTQALGIASDGRETASVKPNWHRSFFVGKSPAGGVYRVTVEAPAVLYRVTVCGVDYDVVWDGSVR